MSISVKQFIEDFQAKKIVNNKINEHAVEDYIKETLNIKTYLPFQAKREIVKEVVDASIDVVNGYKIIRSTDQFLSFVIAMLVSYTDFEIDDPYEAYDLLSESHLLQPIIECFRSEYDACDVLLKMEMNDSLQTNATPAIIAAFLDKISGSFGKLGEALQEQLDELNIDDILDSANIGSENLASIKELLNK